MRHSLLFLSALFFIYSCTEISGRETPRTNKKATANEKEADLPREDLRVGREEALQMRGRRGKDDASLKISAKDLQALMNSSNPAENDSFVFYFVTYNSKSDKEKRRYQSKVQNANWDNVGRKPSTLLVGFVSGRETEAMQLTGKKRIPVIPVYDLAVVCPPPPNCGCEIAQ